MLARSIKDRTILHIDFNSYFATVEQQANPRLRGKPIGVTGGDRVKRTVLGAASVEAKKFGVKTGMQIWEAKKLCPNLILVPGDSDKYLEVTKRFLAILSSYSPYVEVFSIDECFMEIVASRNPSTSFEKSLDSGLLTLVTTAKAIKSRIKAEIGDYITCSIGISYNKLMAKLAGSLKKPDGLVVIKNQEEAIKILDKIELDEICGIGPRIKRRLNNMGIFNFYQLRRAPLKALLASFKSYGRILYNMARGIDESKLIPYFEKEEVKSIGHRYTIDHDTSDPDEIKQILLKLTELIARRLRAKNLVGKTIHCWYRESLVRIYNPGLVTQIQTGIGFAGGFGRDGMPASPAFGVASRGEQTTVFYTNDGLEIFKAAWKIFNQIWDKGEIRMIGASVSNLKPMLPQTLSFLPETRRQERLLDVIDKINDKYGEFTLERGTLLGSSKMRRMPNPFLSDRRFKFNPRKKPLAGLSSRTCKPFG